MLGDVLVFVVVAGAILGAMVLLRTSMRRGGLGRSQTARPDDTYLDRPVVPVLPPPPPPPRPDEQRALSASRDQAILLRREFPPRTQTLSHWGGIPLASRGFTWPFYVADDGSERALHLVLQLDCAASPREGRLGLMPDTGMLYVFLDLDWGSHWKWSVRYETGDPTEFVPAKVPASLPRAYGHRDTWRWPRRDDEWPRMLPHWSIDPVLLKGDPGREPEEGNEQELDYWPGSIALGPSLERIEGAVVPQHFFQNSYDENGALVRPYPTYPHDWQAVRIAMGHAVRHAGRQHLDGYVSRGDMTEAEAASYVTSMRETIDDWSRRADAAEPFAPLTPAESDAVWQFFLDHQKVALFGLGEAVNESLDATLAGNPDALTVLPDEALELVRGHHALASRSDTGLHIYDTARMLCAPSYVQGDAEQRIGEWLLLLEMSETRPIGHLFAEGVYQFWIRPADLAARQFHLVELTTSAY